MKNQSRPSTRACLNCREKHLRCNGQQPTCSRCAELAIDCVFVRSRRGCRRSHGKGPQKASGVAPILTPASLPLADAPVSVAPFAPTLPGIVDPIVNSLAAPSPSTESFEFPAISPAPRPTAREDQNASGEAIDSALDSQFPENYSDPLIDVYYQNLHPAHPFLLPQMVYRQQPHVFPLHLRQAMRYLASHHAVRTASLNAVDQPDMFAEHIVEDGFKVQSLILIALSAYARFERSSGHRALNAAFELSLRLGLNSDAYAWDASSVFRESWRRTWWELYVISGLVSLSGGLTMTMPLPIHMSLPVSCTDYIRGHVPPTGSIEQMRARFSSEQPQEWSSFAYRIEAVRLLRMVLQHIASSDGTGFVAVQAALSSFFFSLPLDKRDGLREDCEPDEVMSCAIMTAHIANICLHLPRSSLANDYVVKTVCGSDQGQISDEHPRLHRLASLRSSAALLRIISLRESIKTLSPCFVCAIAFAAVVQLSECFMHQDARRDDAREQLQLALSALGEMGTVWPIAHVVRGQIALFARELCHQRSGEKTLPSPISLEFNDINEPWLQNLIADTMHSPLPEFFLAGS